MLAFETYFTKTELPPQELHLSSNIPKSFQVEHDALGKSLAVLDLLLEQHTAAYPKTRSAVGQLVSRNIFFGYGQLAYFHRELESLCSRECSELGSPSRPPARRPHHLADRRRPPLLRGGQGSRRRGRQTHQR